VTQFVPGLEGIVAAQTSISMVDGQNGRLLYRGYVIADLAERMSFEEVAHLLIFGELPTRAQLRDFSARMAKGRRLSPAAEAVLDALPADTDPMDVLRSAISVQGSSPHLRKPDAEQAVAYAAAVPVMLARFHRRRRGLPGLESRPELSHAANYLYLFDGKEPKPELARALDTYLVLLADHGMNASTFTARVIASTDSDLASSLTGALGALRGPAHGGAPGLVLDQLELIQTPAGAERWLREARTRKVRFMGFGHRVYRTYDPRARIFKEMARRLNPKFYALASEVEEHALRILEEEHPERPNATNVEFYSAGVLQAVGLPRDLFTATFAVARVAGWCAHVLEQVGHNRLIRPQSEYVGPPARSPKPIEQRG